MSSYANQTIPLLPSGLQPSYTCRQLSYPLLVIIWLTYAYLDFPFFSSPLSSLICVVDILLRFPEWNSIQEIRQSPLPHFGKLLSLWSLKLHLHLWSPHKRQVFHCHMIQPPEIKRAAPFVVTYSYPYMPVGSFC